MTSLNVFEIYPSIQGESTHAGRKCVFIRLAGCNLECAYCDSAEAAKGQGAPMDVPAILGQVRAHGIGLVELTGGEPLIQSGAASLIEALCDGGFQTLVETNGTVDIGRLDRRAMYIVDIKTPGAGAGVGFNENNFAALGRKDEVKFVVTSREDFLWAEALATERGLASKCAVIFSPAQGRVALAELAGWLLESGLDARLGLQIHKVIWGPDATGV